MHAPWFGTQSKQSSKQPFQREMKASVSNLKIKTERHTLKSASGYVSKMAANGIRTHARTNQRYSWPVYMIQTKMAFLRAGFYLANKNNLKSFQNTLIGWLLIFDFC